MKTLNLYWGYLIGEEHLTEEQFAQIEFGDPNFDTEFITFDPLASTYFQGKYYKMHERKFYFPHRTLPSMKTENMVVYEDTHIKISDPPADLGTPPGILLCFLLGNSNYINHALNFLEEKLNLKFSPCEFDFEVFLKKLGKTRLEVSPQSLTISDLRIDENLSGNLEVITHDKTQFHATLKTYKPKVRRIKVVLKEVNFQIRMKIKIDGSISFDRDIINLNLQDTIYDTASRSVYTGNI